MLDALAAGFKECKLKPIVGPKLQLDGFLDGMLRSRISRRIMAEQHICLAARRPGFIGIICADLSLPDAVHFAAQRTKQVSHHMSVMWLGISVTACLIYPAAIATVP